MPITIVIVFNFIKRSSITFYSNLDPIKWNHIKVFQIVGYQGTYVPPYRTPSCLIQPNSRDGLPSVASYLRDRRDVFQGTTVSQGLVTCHVWGHVRRRCGVFVANGCQNIMGTPLYHQHLNELFSHERQLAGTTGPSVWILGSSPKGTYYPPFCPATHLEACKLP